MYMTMKLLSDAYYLIGVYYLLSNNYSEAIRFLELTARLKEQQKGV